MREISLNMINMELLMTAWLVLEKITRISFTNLLDEVMDKGLSIYGLR